MKVSIAVATYNGETYLEQQLESFLRQTRQPDEVVISDDNSTDKTVDILRSFERKASFEVKIIENDENVGYRKNFERALQNTTGDLIFMSDQDDVWFEYKVDRIIKYAQNDPEIQVFINDTELTDEDLNPSGRTKMEQIKSLRMGMRTMVMGTCTAIRRSFLSILLPIPNKYMEGHDDWIHDLAKVLEARKLIPESLQYYRIHGDNTSTSIVNRAEKINFFKHYIDKLISQDSLKTTLANRLERKKLLKKWVSVKNEELNKILNNEIGFEEILGRLQEEINAIENRVSIYEKDGLERLKIISKMIFNRQYFNHFSGFRSSLRDLIT